MLTMIGLVPRRKSGRASRINSMGAKKFTSISRLARWGSASSNRPIAPAPALLTRMSSPPKRAAAASIELLPRRRIGHVADDRLDLAPVGLDPSTNSRSRSSRRAATTSPCPLPRQLDGQRPADPAGRPGYNRPAALNVAFRHGHSNAAWVAPYAVNPFENVEKWS